MPSRFLFGSKSHASFCFAFIKTAIVGQLLTVLVAIHAAEPSWPQHLGPGRNGISLETGLIDSWPAGGPKEVWRTSGGVGMSGLAIERGRLITLIQTDDAQFVVAHKAKTGELLWKTAIAPAYKNGMGDGPRATPTIAGESVFVFSGEGILAALQFEDGAILWSHNVVKQLKGKPAEYGMACSPLVVGGQVIVTAGAPKATLAAYDVKSGKQIWTAGSDRAGYSSPALLDVGGERQIVVTTGGSVLGVKPSSGEVLWRYPYVTDYDCNIATPISHQGNVFISSGESHGCVLLSVKKAGGEYAVGEVWTSLGVGGVMRNEWQTSILLNGLLYGMDNVGSAGAITHLTCVNASTGERIWRKTRFGKGNLIAADGKLFISTLKGELVVVQATPKGFRETGRQQVIGPTRQAPALAGGLLYVRDNNDIVCFDVKK